MSPLFGYFCKESPPADAGEADARGRLASAAKALCLLCIHLRACEANWDVLECSGLGFEGVQHVYDALSR